MLQYKKHVLNVHTFLAALSRSQLSLPHIQRCPLRILPYTGYRNQTKKIISAYKSYHQKMLQQKTWFFSESLFLNVLNCCCLQQLTLNCLLFEQLTKININKYLNKFIKIVLSKRPMPSPQIVNNLRINIFYFLFNDLSELKKNPTTNVVLYN